MNYRESTVVIIMIVVIVAFVISILYFVSKFFKGRDRGIPVNIFEAEIKDYVLDKDTKIPRAIFSHSYLKVREFYNCMIQFYHFCHLSVRPRYNVKSYIVKVL